MPYDLEFSHADFEFQQRLEKDYPFFARHAQRIEPKDLLETDEGVRMLAEALLEGDDDPTPGMVPIIFRPGQGKLHAFVEEQMARRGMVRAALVKPRQVGWSTYIQGRAHWRASHTPMLKVFIISHNADSTRKFLRRVRLLCKTAPAIITPGRPVENAKELLFDNGASYGIATAGTPDAMRSDSCHILHGSEVPFWPKYEDTMGSIIPALSDGPGSEGYLESTSRGRGTPWHNFILECLAGENMFEVFFDAWFNHPYYRLPPPPGWEPDDEGREAAALYKLDIAQSYWRAMKIKALRALWLFKQEYPGTIDESFQASYDTLYHPDVVFRARKSNIPLDPYAPLILGCDPARTGDRTVLAFRQGKVFRDVITYPKMDDMRLVQILAQHLNTGYQGKKVAKCFIDYAIGEGVASRLRELGFGDLITVVHFGEGAAEERYANKRIEMAMNMRDWFGDRGDQVSIPDSDDVASDLLAIPDFLQQDGSEKLKLAPKEQIKKDYGKSPDIFDAMILTFAYPVRGERIAELAEFTRQELSHIAPTDLGPLMSDFEAF